MSEITVTDAVLVANMIADIYFRAKQAGIKVTPENIRDHITNLEARAAANDQALGLES